MCLCVCVCVLIMSVAEVLGGKTSIRLVGAVFASAGDLDRKLFFIAMGQTWCEKTKKAGALSALLTDQVTTIVFQCCMHASPPRLESREFNRKN